jgi:hypothetical protein
MDNEHNTFAYCTSFFSPSPRFNKMTMEVELVQQRKKRRGNGINGRPKIKRINKNGSEAISINK